ncbi:MAG TPA: amino acid ABC transporter permease [Ktedonosporobacter sp.]|jgi:His/Glu/Gln/Arg/opine family amino acid ABC transporter permease subunit|nr:amino acid ABC transporter permease [Ktedonosporobacter sp.]
MIDKPVAKGALTREKMKARSRGRLASLDYLFYVVAAVAIFAFIYYLYAFRQLGRLYLPVFLQGTLTTLVISLVSIVLATCFGFIGALGRLARFAPVRWLAITYVEVVRGTPVLVQLLLWYYGVGFVLSSIGFDPYSAAFQLMTALQNNSLVPDAFNGYFYGILGLSFNYGAYLTEVFRSGIETVDKGQTEAGLSLGLNSRQIMRHIVLPQAIRITIPPFTNYFITLIQDSALLSVLSLIELEHVTYALALPQINANNKMFVFILGALFYLLLCYPLSLLARYFEKRMAVAY